MLLAEGLSQFSRLLSGIDRKNRARTFVCYSGDKHVLGTQRCNSGGTRCSQCFVSRRFVVCVQPKLTLPIPHALQLYLGKNALQLGSCIRCGRGRKVPTMMRKTLGYHKYR